VPDALAWQESAARLDGAAGRLAVLLDAVSVGPSDWSGATADQFRADLGDGRRQLDGVATALRRQAALMRTTAASLPS
jgi:hypothetical protein